MSAALLQRVAILGGRLPRYVTVGVENPQRRVRVLLEGATAFDVTTNHVIASVNPLTIAIAVDSPHWRTGDTDRAGLRISPVEQADRLLGRIHLSHHDSIRIDGADLPLFRVTGSANACLRGMPAVVFRLHHAWAGRRSRPAASVTPGSLRDLQVAYMCPRPVVLVSVRHGTASNLFPMDLVGPLANSHFMLSLRSTSPSIPLILQSRRLALADVPLELADAARALGVHHRKTGIDWDALPFATEPSPVHGLRVPGPALRLREVEVLDTRVIGSHVLFITRVLHEVQRRSGLQMAGISGSYYRYLWLRGDTLPTA